MHKIMSLYTCQYEQASLQLQVKSFIKCLADFTIIQFIAHEKVVKGKSESSKNGIRPIILQFLPAS